MRQVATCSGSRAPAAARASASSKARGAPSTTGTMALAPSLPTMTRVSSAWVRSASKGPDTASIRLVISASISWALALRPSVPTCLGQIVDDEAGQGVGAIPEGGSPACGQADPLRDVGIGEAEDEDLVPRRRGGGTDHLEGLPHQGAATGAGATPHEDVVPRGVDRQAEREGLGRALLAHDPRRGGHLGGGSEG